ncbi:uncharacterized protein LOC129940836 isoform X2 [Eupeodes corollae]|nr:uncharacterized protein LOC129940836 isoform X2 [Eupeodes corollae]
MDFLQMNCNNNAIEPLTSSFVVTAGIEDEAKAGCMLQQQQLMQLQSPNMCSINTYQRRRSPIATTLPSTVLNQHNANSLDVGNSNFQIYDILGRKYLKEDNNYCADKTTKNLTNLNERQSADNTNNIVAASKQHVNKDEMEQWVSDTFYSYFPGFNNENKKRQDLLQDRQLEYQQNFIKHQMNEAAANSGKKKYSNSHHNNKNNQEEKLEQNIPKETIINHKSQPPLSTSRSSSDKTDLEIIVNNPDYEIKSPRPGSARHRLLQDLKHTEISNIVNNDGVTERNRRNAEMEMAKKRNYQKELMAQIEEHRRSIEILKEKERRQDEALTRKLEEQLKTMHLQEELEKEKMRADKMRFDSEQNRLMREHLLTKLENDTKVLDASVRKTHSELEKISPTKNKVYKYFSNSARHEFRRDATLDEQPAFHLNLPTSSTPTYRRHQKKCFHDMNNDKNICPFCASTLKSYESWCLKCERKIFEISSTSNGEIDPLVCANCKKLYSTCPNCDKAEETNCMHCQRKQNFCSNCRKTLCTDCIDAIAVGKDNSNHRHKDNSERSFEILEVNYPDNDVEDANDLNNNQERSRPPFSINIDRNSIFHHDFDRSKLFDDENSIEEIRYETDKQLSRYLKNYGDLACKALRDRSTQTTPDSASRRDIVMVEENNLSMPLLREMPRMTRKESNLQQAERKKKGTRIENLSRRWEVPAVQKHTITTNSPKVLTQLGAIKRQLQSEQLHLDF